MQTVLWPILRRAMLHPRSTAIIDDQRTWRYADLVGGAVHLAKRIEQETANPHIGVMLPTGGAFPMAALATWMLGRTLVPINYLLGEDERRYVIEHSGIDTLITARAMLDVVGEPRNVRLLELDKMSFRGVPPLRFPAIASCEDNAAILYTSGTSGRPKGVMLTHRNLRSNIDNTVKHMELGRFEGFVGVLPQFHAFGFTALTLAPLSIGVKIINTARFVPRKIVELIREHRPDIMIAIPSMYAALANVKSAGPDDMRSIRVAGSGGEPLPRDVFERFHERFDIRICEGYGLTETSPVVSINSLHEYRDTSVGRPIPKCSVRVIDEQGRDVPAGERGEVIIGGPNVMAGYYKQPEFTEQVIDDAGYLHTGDWGKLDEDGYLYITGRKKEMLIIGGENVFPREIEEVLNRHESVKASAVIAKQDPVRGELPIAIVELEEGAELDEAALRKYCREHLAGYKVPREVRAIEELPRNAMGKILRKELVP